MGQEAVAWVTLNRVESKQFPDTVCDVVKQPKQFSWYNGIMSLATIKNSIIELRAWNKTKKLAAKVINDFVAGRPDPTHGALFYHNKDVSPSWAAPENVTAVIGDHTFYKQAVVTVASR